MIKASTAQFKTDSEPRDTNDRPQDKGEGGDAIRKHESLTVPIDGFSLPVSVSNKPPGVFSSASATHEMRR
jgi:hypothetical protein